MLCAILSIHAPPIGQMLCGTRNILAPPIGQVLCVIQSNHAPPIRQVICNTKSFLVPPTGQMLCILSILPQSTGQMFYSTQYICASPKGQMICTILLIQFSLTVEFHGTTYMQFTFVPSTGKVLHVYKSVFPLMHWNGYLTQENVKMTCHFRPSHKKINWHVVKGDGEKTGNKKMSHLAHDPMCTKMFFIHVACWRASHVHCFWCPLSLIFSFFCFIDKNAETNCQ